MAGLNEQTLNMQWLEIRKADDEQRIVEGFASTEIPDTQPGIWKGEIYEGDLVDADAIEAALPDYMEWANVREMHQPSAVGTVLKAEVIRGTVEIDGRAYINPLHIIAKIVDEEAWKKVKEGVYKGFSIGGQAVNAVLEKIGGRKIRRIVKLLLSEISLADRPANAGSRILLWKYAGSIPQEKLEGGVTVADKIKKVADPQKALGMLQALRDEAELGGDLESANLYSQAIALLLQANGDAESAPEPEAEPEAAAEPEPGSDTALEEEAGAAMQMAAKPALRKAGRTFSGQNVSAMHSVIQALAGMLAASGDSVAQGVLKCYGPKEEQKSVQPDDIQKIVNGALEPVLGESGDLAKLHGSVGDLQKLYNALAERVDGLERKPAPGGPQLRPVEKVLASDVPTPEDAGEDAAPAKSITDLRRAAATEPNPLFKAELNRQLVIAEQAITKRKA